ncbi:hypothetical protein RJ639_046408 [Escallonia herrerae]|uniref:Uncharacterized protein n=1 Tax=Escallonia herrerae TaxID=1293975 RepID=A0AA89B1H3_9ASTE|nr:hypothetical protein RJ639_046408 [Escallonia herrerae]
MALSQNSLIIGSYPSSLIKLAPAPLSNGNTTLRFNTSVCITTTSSCSSRQVVLSALSPASANTTVNTVSVHPHLGDDQNDNPASPPVASANSVLTLAEPEDFVVMYKLIKLLPTVGCEADAATRYSIDERIMGGAANIVSSLAYQSSGGYIAVWPAKDHPTFRLFELEHCLVDPQNRESRVWIIQVLCFENSKLVFQNIKVFVEQWYGPFRNGEQLGGCAIRDSTFAATDALKKKSARDECNLILLPKNLWCSLKEREDGETCCEEIATVCETAAVTH